MDSSINPLDTDNYSSWSVDMKVFLKEQICWMIVTGTEIKPIQRKLKSGSLIDKTGSNFICKKGQINAYDKYGQKVFPAKKVLLSFDDVQISFRTFHPCVFWTRLTPHPQRAPPQFEKHFAKRYNYPAFDAIEVMLNSSGLNKGLCSEALQYHTYVWNRICAIYQSLILFELYISHKLPVKHLKPFGATTYLDETKQLRKKLDMKAKQRIMF
ncbi:retrovirus-related Pol polyprotein from transposon TNT 1-94 [Trichonephila clavipes]|uniref:Retrovirus-related Pol polyprotein from transposon TNT 1-94 n=1 Tax=Trichonephila clavipes TaxID=2585209 RepID=A0A8X6UYY8_TRICX|nr:retrovirus-related Pol polyprotein from transposon TNT 1-94 [Trichonephila clavipes]